VTELPPVLRRRIPRLVAVGAAFCQLWVLAVEMTRVQAGPNAPLNPLGGKWHPAVGSLTVLAVAALGAAALIALVWTATAAETAPVRLAETVPAPAEPAAEPARAAVQSAVQPAGQPAVQPAAEPQVVPEPANS
jgi:hypothetical protein